MLLLIAEGVGENSSRKHYQDCLLVIISSKNSIGILVPESCFFITRKCSVNKHWDKITRTKGSNTNLMWTVPMPSDLPRQPSAYMLFSIHNPVETDEETV